MPQPQRLGEILNPSVWLQHLLLRRDVKIERPIKDIPSLSEDQIREIKSALYSYSVNAGFQSVEGYIFDDLLIGYPINMIEMKGILYAVRHVSGEPTTRITWHKTRSNSAEEQASYERLKESLKSALDEMIAEKQNNRSRDRMISEQDTAHSAARAAKLSAWATAFAAVAAIAQVVIALLK